MRTAIHQAPDELLLEYAAGTLSTGEALLVATHVSLCPSSRRTVDVAEATAGAMLLDVPGVAMSDDALSRTLARLAEPFDEPAPKLAYADSVLPAPLRERLGLGIEAINWRPVTRALAEFPIAEENGQVRTRLMRISAGAMMPKHTHTGDELTLVLDGGFTDDGRDFVRGDLAIAGPGHDHAPAAHRGPDCVCLVVTTAPLRLTGAIGRWLNPFIRF